MYITSISHNFLARHISACSSSSRCRRSSRSWRHSRTLWSHTLAILGHRLPSHSRSLQPWLQLGVPLSRQPSASGGISYHPSLRKALPLLSDLFAVSVSIIIWHRAKIIVILFSLAFDGLSRLSIVTLKPWLCFNLTLLLPPISNDSCAVVPGSAAIDLARRPFLHGNLPELCLRKRKNKVHLILTLWPMKHHLHTNHTMRHILVLNLTPDSIYQLCWKT